MGHNSFLFNPQHAEAVSENPYQIVTDELLSDISVMYLKLKAAAMHRFRLNGHCPASYPSGRFSLRSGMNKLLKSTQGQIQELRNSVPHFKVDAAKMETRSLC